MAVKGKQRVVFINVSEIRHSRVGVQQMFECKRVVDLVTYVDLVRDHDFLAIGLNGNQADICCLHMEGIKREGGLIHVLLYYIILCYIVLLLLLAV